MQARYVFAVLHVFFNDTATTEIYTLSLHDALPISTAILARSPGIRAIALIAISPSLISGTSASSKRSRNSGAVRDRIDRKSTRLNSSHANISYAVFCLKQTYLLYHGARAYVHGRHH